MEDVAALRAKAGMLGIQIPQKQENELALRFSYLEKLRITDKVSVSHVLRWWMGLIRVGNRRAYVITNLSSIGDEQNGFAVGIRLRIYNKTNTSLCWGCGATLAEAVIKSYRLAIEDMEWNELFDGFDYCLEEIPIDCDSLYCAKARMYYQWSLCCEGLDFARTKPLALARALHCAFAFYSEYQWGRGYSVPPNVSERT